MPPGKKKQMEGIYPCIIHESIHSTCWNGQETDLCQGRVEALHPRLHAALQAHRLVRRAELVKPLICDNGNQSTINQSVDRIIERANACKTFDLKKKGGGTNQSIDRSYNKGVCKRKLLCPAAAGRQVIGACIYMTIDQCRMKIGVVACAHRVPPTSPKRESRPLPMWQNLS